MSLPNTMCGSPDGKLLWTTGALGGRGSKIPFYNKGRAIQKSRASHGVRERRAQTGADRGGSAAKAEWQRATPEAAHRMRTRHACHARACRRTTASVAAGASKPLWACTSLHAVLRMVWRTVSAPPRAAVPGATYAFMAVPGG
eukprot:353284-Chlamydomonas_euryale.AAC.2